VSGDKKSVFITGASGFVGRNLVEYLRGKHSDDYLVISPTHRELELLDYNKVSEFIKANDINIIIHCAGVGGSRKTGYDMGKTDVVSKNLRMFFNLARCLEPEMSMIHLGSGAEYHKRYYTPKMPEDYFDKHVPEDDYGLSKYVISKYIEKTENIICLRIFGLYGRYEDYSYKFISNAILKNILHLPIVINQNVVFDYLYIDDFLSIVEHFIGKKARYRHINVTPSDSIDLVSIARIINDIGGFKSEIRILNKGMNREYSGDNSRLLREIGDFRFTPYRKGIKRLYDYYRLVIKTIDVKAIKDDPYLKYCKTT
jgi:GDP-L-fucose synthase